MKIIKYIFAILLLLLSIAEVVPIYLILSGLILGQADGNTTYFVGKLSAHIALALIMFYFGLRIIKNIQNNNEAAIKNT